MCAGGWCRLGGLDEWSLDGREREGEGESVGVCCTGLREYVVCFAFNGVSGDIPPIVASGSFFLSFLLGRVSTHRYHPGMARFVRK